VPNIDERAAGGGSRAGLCLLGIVDGGTRGRKQRRVNCLQIYLSFHFIIWSQRTTLEGRDFFVWRGWLVGDSFRLCGDRGKRKKRLRVGRKGFGLLIWGGQYGVRRRRGRRAAFKGEPEAEKGADTGPSCRKGSGKGGLGGEGGQTKKNHRGHGSGIRGGRSRSQRFLTSLGSIVRLQQRGDRIEKNGVEKSGASFHWLQSFVMPEVRDEVWKKKAKK